MLSLSGMSQLLVRNIPEALVKKLKRRAVENGVSAEEEHRRILRAALEKPANKGKKPYTMFDHFRKLGEIAPDFDFERKRRPWRARPLEL
jgi:antitoxin FitA